MTEDLLREVIRVGEELPLAVARDIAAGCDLTRIHPVERREAVARLVKRWGDRPLGELRTALLTASAAGDHHRREQSIELVWTGPDSQVIPVRQTEQVVLDLIAGARKSLLVVSYAVYKIPRICEALMKAADRGVRIRIVLEIGDPTNQVECKPVAAIGSELAKRAEILYWPNEKRYQSAGGNCGVLHVKCIVADGNRLLLSSANLTDYAFRANMELGLLVKGTEHLTRIQQHFTALLGAGILKSL